MLHSPVLQALLQLIHVRFVVTKKMNKANKNTFVHDFISLNFCIFVVTHVTSLLLDLCEGCKSS